MPKTPPKPPRKKNEISPNNRSKCQRCGTKITKGEQRYGVVEFNEYGRTQRYYHPNCCPESAKRKIPSVEESSALNEHSVLYENLRRLRRLFADELEVEPYKIFHDRSLEELVAHTPSSESQLLDIWGIKEKKVQSFGSAILAVIRQYTRQQDVKVKTQPTERAAPRPKKKRKKVARASKSQDKDDVIEVGETLTCEEIVAQKFKHAQDNGYMISVD